LQTSSGPRSTLYRPGTPGSAQTATWASSPTSLETPTARSASASALGRARQQQRLRRQARAPSRPLGLRLPQPRHPLLLGPSTSPAATPATPTRPACALSPATMDTSRQGRVSVWRTVCRSPSRPSLGWRDTRWRAWMPRILVSVATHSTMGITQRAFAPRIPTAIPRPRVGGHTCGLSPQAPLVEGKSIIRFLPSSAPPRLRSKSHIQVYLSLERDRDIVASKAIQFLRRCFTAEEEMW
jgi:hypothetical protein